MRKVVTIFICICVFSFLVILYVTNSNEKYVYKLKKEIIKNTDVKEIDYFNKYDNYYIVLDKEYLYIFDNKYVELLRIDKILIHENVNKYDIIYNDNKVVYMNDYYKNKKLICEYYDLYTYKLINSFESGG